MCWADEGKSNITRVNFSLLLYANIWRELNKMKKLVQEEKKFSTGRYVMYLHNEDARMEQCEAISFCGHFRVHYGTFSLDFLFYFLPCFFPQTVGDR